MANIRNKIFYACESFLRVPPLLMVDEIFRISFGFGGKLIEYGAKNLVTTITPNSTQNGGNDNNSNNNGGISSDSGSGSYQSYDGNASYVEWEKSILNSSSSDLIVGDHQTSSVSNNPFLNYYGNNEKNASVYSTSGGAFSSSSTSSSTSSPSLPTTGVSGSKSEELLGNENYFLDSWTTVWNVFNNVSPSSGVNLTDAGAAAAAFISGSNQSDYLLHLSFGDLSGLREGTSWELLRVGEVLGCLMLFFAAIIMFLLSTENLLKLYSYLVSILTIYLAYVTAPIPLLWEAASFPSLLYNIVFRTGLAGLFFLARIWTAGQPQFENPNITSVVDSLVFSLFYICGVVHLQPVIYIALVMVLQNSLWACIPKVYSFLKESWSETRRVQNEYGLSHLIQVECARLRVNTVFRLFWISRAAYDAFFRCCDESVAHVFRYVMSHGTETFTGIVGLTVTVSVICHSIGEFLLWLLYLGTNSETDANRFGSISTVLFFILSLQTGLTSLDPEKRLDRLLKNVVLLGTALFHALHQMVAPLLHAFRTFQGLQIRAVSISVVSLTVSILSTVYLLRFSSVSTWSLAVLALAIEFKIKIVISLVISIVVYLSQLVQYPEFLQKMCNCLRMVLPSGLNRVIDKLADQLSHEDMVFYLKSFANVAEFLTGIFLFVNAVWIFMFESASAIRAIGMTIHAYFNIWCEARKGWKIYCQRKTASMKIMSLADATDEQLAGRKDDVCAICYEEMESAKVTLCGHLFHAVCLRKWLYVQNTCPLCHELLYGEDALDESSARGAGGQQGQEPQVPGASNGRADPGSLAGSGAGPDSGSDSFTPDEDDDFFENIRVSDVASSSQPLLLNSSTSTTVSTSTSSSSSSAGPSDPSSIAQRSRNKSDNIRRNSGPAVESRQSMLELQIGAAVNAFEESGRQRNSTPSHRESVAAMRDIERDDLLRNNSNLQNSLHGHVNSNNNSVSLNNGSFPNNTPNIANIANNPNPNNSRPRGGLAVLL